MNILQKKIKLILNEIKEREREKENKTLNTPSEQEFVMIKMIFDYKKFNQSCSSVGDFMKKLKNGKISFAHKEDFGRPKQNNREYFNDLIGEGGFYRYEISEHSVYLDIFFQIKRKFDENIDKDIIMSRINKIVKPNNISIEVGDKKKLRTELEKLSQVNIGWNVFGTEFRNWGLNKP